MQPIPYIRLRVGVKLPEAVALREVDLPVAAPHEGRVDVGRDAGEAHGHVLGEPGLGLHVHKLPVFIT